MTSWITHRTYPIPPTHLEEIIYDPIDLARKRENPYRYH